MSQYEFDAERFCLVRVRAARAQRNFSDEQSFLRVVEEVKRLREEVVKLKESAKGLLAIHKRHKCLTVYSEQDYRDIWSERVDALAALVGEE